MKLARRWHFLEVGSVHLHLSLYCNFKGGRGRERLPCKVCIANLQNFPTERFVDATSSRERRVKCIFLRTQVSRWFTWTCCFGSWVVRLHCFVEINPVQKSWLLQSSLWLNGKKNLVVEGSALGEGMIVRTSPDLSIFCKEIPDMSFVMINVQ